MKKYLSKEERTIIEWELKKKTSCRKIAKQLDRHYSTIIYEVKKNSYRGKYMASKAGELSKDRKAKRGSKLQMSLHGNLLIYIEDNYRKRDNSLKLVLREWKKNNHDAPSLATLYNGVPRGLFKDGYERLLRPRKKALKELKNGKRMIGRPIDLREKEQDMSLFGHGEGDFVVGGKTKEKEYILTILEKKTRFGITQKFVSKDPNKVYESLKEFLSTFDEKIFKSITGDNGIEFTHLPKLEDHFKTRIYFAFPYSSGQRGQNENWNGILRRGYPKGTDFSKVSVQELTSVTNRINNMKREILDFKSPSELFDEFAYKNNYIKYN